MADLMIRDSPISLELVLMHKVAADLGLSRVYVPNKYL